MSGNAALERGIFYLSRVYTHLAETKLDSSFPNSQFLIPTFHEPMRLKW